MGFARTRWGAKALHQTTSRNRGLLFRGREGREKGGEGDWIHSKGRGGRGRGRKAKGMEGRGGEGEDEGLAPIVLQMTPLVLSSPASSNGRSLERRSI